MKILISLLLSGLLTTGQAFCQENKTINEVSFGTTIEVSTLSRRGQDCFFMFYSPKSEKCQNMMNFIRDYGAGNHGVYITIVNIDRKAHKEIDWDSPVSRQYGLKTLPYYILVDSQGKFSDGEEAWKVFSGKLFHFFEEKMAKKISFLHEDSSIYCEFGSFYMEFGEFGKAAEKYRRAVELTGSENEKILYDFACALSRAGRPEEALKNLEKALFLAKKRHTEELLQYFKQDIDLEPLAEQSGFQALLDKY
ncbi:MAG: tetratricopeptide repeat protein [Candidatus Wallbacteria bacterium]|nr:tetratricopeptide repeat protein [Candidatus Wallbacteria bacterium]